ncbi:Lrp/AsnC family transcriptional regulator [Qipengyuania qiaonensis]|uniref:Lrp/AsnC family transcriptional regulator n=1 Tax=Qipengyuania qiaonensis TaxID=2867240 RepID=A0ABS7J6I5_9SPHN|nr:Lrp/AsnC family transcriptional regulator [Qipengyuania qiaonensis]MBX7482935.1 Lrp/AsnC family transcriptional regulator [Qipengyuania qiaonensis]
MDFEMMLDRFDTAIVARLLEGGTATNAELGEAARLSGPAAGRRQRLLESDGYIKGYSPKLNFEKLGFGTLVMVLIQVKSKATDTFEAFENAVRSSPSLLSCHLLSGSEDYLLSLRAKDLKDFERIHREELSKLPGVSGMQSLFALREVLSRDASPSMLSGS